MYQSFTVKKMKIKLLLCNLIMPSKDAWDILVRYVIPHVHTGVIRSKIMFNFKNKSQLMNKLPVVLYAAIRNVNLISLIFFYYLS